MKRRRGYGRDEREEALESNSSVPSSAQRDRSISEPKPSCENAQLFNAIVQNQNKTQSSIPQLIISLPLPSPLSTLAVFRVHSDINGS
ncbi:hypothetical protein PoB_006794000 [Plakobranchus ocellatus]|uniref:Uncharacterized protein n=1 Tax=Plakobranchus ocellatus TaxID=259542 RepID=A0AAV4DBM1_9GAST|nr:hypothetical protein PoB_006794000 [Plakobranchus ocellatus]